MPTTCGHPSCRRPDCVAKRTQLTFPYCVRCGSHDHIGSHCPLNGQMMVQPYRKKRGPLETKGYGRHARRSGGGFWDAIGDLFESIIDIFT